MKILCLHILRFLRSTVFYQTVTVHILQIQELYEYMRNSEFGWKSGNTEDKKNLQISFTRKIGFALNFCLFFLLNNHFFTLHAQLFIYSLHFTGFTLQNSNIYDCIDIMHIYSIIYIIYTPKIFIKITVYSYILIIVTQHCSISYKLQNLGTKIICIYYSKPQCM